MRRCSPLSGRPAKWTPWTAGPRSDGPMRHPIVRQPSCAGGAAAPPGATVLGATALGVACLGASARPCCPPPSRAPRSASSLSTACRRTARHGPRCGAVALRTAGSPRCECSARCPCARCGGLRQACDNSAGAAEQQVHCSACVSTRARVQSGARARVQSIACPRAHARLRLLKVASRLRLEGCFDLTLRSACLGAVWLRYVALARPSSMRIGEYERLYDLNARRTTVLAMVRDARALGHLQLGLNPDD